MGGCGECAKDTLLPHLEIRLTLEPLLHFEPPALQGPNFLDIPTGDCSFVDEGDHSV